MGMADKPNIDLDQLLRCRGIESERVEFKAGWDPKTTGPQVLRTLCAFANDLHNVNGGWVVLGVEEVEGRAVLPPRGLSDADVETAQAWIRGNAQRIEPALQPRLFDDEVEGRRVLVAWMPASDARPHRAPDPRSPERKEYFVRAGSGDVIAKGAVKDALHQMTARTPWDSRRAFDRDVGDIRLSLVREFLREEGSTLADEADDLALLRRLDLVARTNGHEVPLNVALMFFHEDPSRFFHGAWIEVAEFPTGRVGSVLERHEFRGPLHHQVREVVAWIERRFGRLTFKRDDKVEAESSEVYPTRALTEAIANAVYHRGYEGWDEPTKVEIHPDRIEIQSYPGPVPGLRLEQMDAGGVIPPLPARNRRIGEYLRRLRLAEQYRFGVQKIYSALKGNGSPPPRFDWDEERSYFRVILRAHPRYLVAAALREAAELRAQGDEERALDVLLHAHTHSPQSLPLIAELVRGLVDVARLDDAWRVLDAVDASVDVRDVLALADLEHKAGRIARAHARLDQAGPRLLELPEGAYLFGWTKLAFAEELRGSRKKADRELRARLRAEAAVLFERVMVHRRNEPTLDGWAWLAYAQIKRAQGDTPVEVTAALATAQERGRGDPELLEAIRRF